METVFLNFGPLKIAKSVELYGRRLSHNGDIDSGCIILLFGENHKDKRMIDLNVLNACKLFDNGLLHCAGVEEPEIDFAGRGMDDWVEQQSRELLDEYGDDCKVLGFLQTVVGERRFGTFRFGKSLRLLRPSLLVRPVEDPHLHAEAIQRQADYLMRFEDEKFLDDHVQIRREEKWIENLLALVGTVNNGTQKIAILNTGLSHTPRLTSHLSAMSIRCIAIEQAEFLRPILDS